MAEGQGHDIEDVIDLTMDSEGDCEPEVDLEEEESVPEVQEGR